VPYQWLYFIIVIIIINAKACKTAINKQITHSFTVKLLVNTNSYRPTGVLV